MTDKIVLLMLAVLAIGAAIAVPHDPPACQISPSEAMPWVQEQRAGCPDAGVRP